MVFSSTIFLVYFLPLFLLFYQFIDKRYKNYFILLASIFFYSWGAPKFIFILIGSTILDFYIVRALDKSTDASVRKRLLAFSISMNVGLLVFFKYTNFLLENVNAVLGIANIDPFTWTKILLPIGISFYTFQTLTYSIDVYRKVHRPLDKLSDYLLYIMSFPQMIAGPIVRFNLIAKEIISRDEKTKDKLQGFIRFSIGLAKKVLIANVMGAQADLIMNQPASEIGFLMAWVGILAYTFQIYFDFAGYSDMAIGLGRMMGFSFPENFNNPYISKNISEFWRRWHITLGQWMKDYLYIPLGGNRVGSPSRLYFNLWFVFLVSGLWHGASWNFVFWGAFHGLFLILDRLFLIQLLNSLGKIPSILITFFIVMIGWVFFRIEKFSDALAYLGQMFSPSAEGYLEVIPSFYLFLGIAVFFSMITFFDFGKKWEQSVFFNKEMKLPSLTFWTIIAILFYIICLMQVTSSDFNPFIYFRF